jgi:hypothetical protein
MSRTTSKVLLISADDLEDDKLEDGGDVKSVETLSSGAAATVLSKSASTWRTVDPIPVAGDLEDDESEVHSEEESMNQFSFRKDLTGENQENRRYFYNTVLDFAKQSLLFLIVRGSLQAVLDLSAATPAATITLEYRNQLLQSELRRRGQIVESVWRSFLVTAPVQIEGELSFKDLAQKFEKMLFDRCESALSRSRLGSSDENVNMPAEIGLRGEAEICGSRSSSMPEGRERIWPVLSPLDASRVLTGFDFPKVGICAFSIHNNIK